MGVKSHDLDQLHFMSRVDVRHSLFRTKPFDTKHNSILFKKNLSTALCLSINRLIFHVQQQYWRQKDANADPFQQYSKQDGVPEKFLKFGIERTFPFADKQVR